MYSLTLQQAIIEAIRTCFWYKTGLRTFMLGCGVPERYYDAKAVGSKGQFIRVMVGDLATRSGGDKVLNAIAEHLAALDGPVDRDSLDHDTAVGALDHLRKQMEKAGLIQPKASVPDVVKDTAIKRAVQDQKLQAVTARFWELHSWSGTPQERGIEFQKLLRELFGAHDIEYDAPFRLPAQELDGKFEFAGRHFLVEARWRKDEAAFKDLSHFHGKVKTKLTGTLGLFISMEGFEPDAVQSLLQLGERCVLLVNGAEFVKIIQQTISLPDALAQMIDEASKRGTMTVYFKV